MKNLKKDRRTARRFKASYMGFFAGFFCLAICVMAVFFSVTAEAADSNSIVPNVTYESLTDEQAAAYPTAEYPFYVYWNSDSDAALEFQGAFKSLSGNNTNQGALAYVRDPLNGVNITGNKAYIVMQSNYSSADAYYSNTAYVFCDVYIDLNQKTLTETNTYGAAFFSAEAKVHSDNITNAQGAFYVYSSTGSGKINMKSTQSPLIFVNSFGPNYFNLGKRKDFNYSFENVGFDLANIENPLINHVDADNSKSGNEELATMDVDGTEVGLNLVFNNCTFYREMGSSPAADNNMRSIFNAKDNSVYTNPNRNDGNTATTVINSCVNITVRGGFVKTDPIDGLELYNYNEEYSDPSESGVVFGKWNGNYMDFRVRARSEGQNDPNAEPLKNSSGGTVIINGNAIKKPSSLDETSADYICSDELGTFGNNLSFVTYRNDLPDFPGALIEGQGWFYYYYRLTEPYDTDYGYVPMAIWNQAKTDPAMNFLVFDNTGDFDKRTSYKRAYQEWSISQDSDGIKTEEDNGDGTPTDAECESAFGYAYGKSSGLNTYDFLHTVLLTKDFIHDSGYYGNTCKLRGMVHLDLGNHTMRCVQAKLLNFEAKSGKYGDDSNDEQTGSYHSTRFKISNGKLTSDGHAFIYCGAFGELYSTDSSVKTFKADFDRVEFAFTEGKTGTNLLFDIEDGKQAAVFFNGKQAINEITFNNCVFDISGSTSNVLFNAKDESVIHADQIGTVTNSNVLNTIVNVTCIGGSLKSNKAFGTVYLANRLKTNECGFESKIIFKPNEEGKYLSCILPEDTAWPNAAVHPDKPEGENNFYNIHVDGGDINPDQTNDLTYGISDTIQAGSGMVAYELKSPTVIEFTTVTGAKANGTVPVYYTEQSEKFPFAVINYNGEPGGVYKNWKPSVARLSYFAVPGDASKGATLYMLRDFEIGDNNDSGDYSLLNGYAVIDLGGNTFTRRFIDTDGDPATAGGSVGGYFLRFDHRSNNDGNQANIRIVGGTLENLGLDYCGPAGDVRTYAPIYFGVNAGARGKTEINMTFEDVGFYANETANALLFETRDAIYEESDEYLQKALADEIGNEIGVSFNNCEFDFENPDAQIFGIARRTADGYGIGYREFAGSEVQFLSNDIQVTVNGGTAKSANPNPELFICDPEDSFSVGSYNGVYLTYILPTRTEARYNSTDTLTVTQHIAPTYAFYNGGDKHGDFKEMLDPCFGMAAVDGLTVSYRINSYRDSNLLSFAFVEFVGDNSVYQIAEPVLVDTEPDREQKIYEKVPVPAFYYTSTDYSFLIFCKGKFCHAEMYLTGNNYAGALTRARNLVGQDGLEKRTYVLATRDAPNPPQGYNNIGLINGIVKIDLNGHTIPARSGANIFDMLLKGGKSYYTRFEVFNGTIELLDGAGLVSVSTNPAGAGQVGEITFRDINVRYSESPATKAQKYAVIECGRHEETIMSNDGEEIAGVVRSFGRVNFENCEIDLKTNAPTGTVSFLGLSDDYLENCLIDVTMRGGNIRISDFEKCSLFEYTDADSINFLPDGEGKYTTITADNTSEAPKYYLKNLAEGGRLVGTIQDSLDAEIKHGTELAPTYTENNNLIKVTWIVGTEVSGTGKVTANVEIPSRINTAKTTPRYYNPSTGQMYNWTKTESNGQTTWEYKYNLKAMTTNAAGESLPADIFSPTKDFSSLDSRSKLDTEVTGNYLRGATTDYIDAREYMSFALVASDQTTNTYSVVESVEVGDNGSKMLSYYADNPSYPFSVFDDGVNTKSFEHWPDALTYARGKTIEAHTVAPVIRMNADYSVVEGKQGWIYGHQNGTTIVVDLGGHELIRAENAYIMDLYFHNNTGVYDDRYERGFGAVIEFRNGFLVNASYKNNLSNYTTYGLFCPNYNVGAQGNDAVYDASYTLNFYNVTVRDDRPGVYPNNSRSDLLFSIWESGLSEENNSVVTAGDIDVYANFYDSTIIAKDAPFAMYRHSATQYALVDIHVTMAGGKIISSSDYTRLYYANKTGDKCYDEDDDSLVFTKYNGKYTSFEFKTSAGAPGYVLDCTEGSGSRNAVLVKTDEDKINGVTYYELTYSSTIDNFAGTKANLTYMSELICNIYVPVIADNADASIHSVDVNGTLHSLRTLPLLNKATIDGGEYYVISVSLPSDKMAEEITVIVTLNVDGSLFSATYTVSTLSYAKKIIEGAYDATEKHLVSDMLSYIKSAYNFFELGNAAQKGTEIDAILATPGASVSNGFALINQGVTQSDNISTYFDSVTMVLDSRPTFRFYLKQGKAPENFVFTQGYGESRVVLAYIEGEDTNGRYVDISLYAYRMVETVNFTYSDGETTDTGYYHINSYYNYASANYQEAVDLVKKFYNYCKSAREYRNYIVSKA